MLNHSTHRLAPLVVIVRGAQLFWGFLAVVSCAPRPFPFAEAVYSRSDVEFPCRCAGFSVGRGSASLARWFAFAPPLVSDFSALRAALSRLCALSSGRVHRFASVRGGAVEKTHRFPLIHNLFSTGLSTLWRNCSPPLAYSSPPFPFPSAGHTDPLPPGRRKRPSRAYIYIGVAKGEKGSAPSAAFRCGRGGLGARGADRWPRPMDKGLVGGQGARKGVGERAVRGAAGVAIGRRQAKALGGAHGVCTRVATVGEEEGSPGRCACTIRAQMQVELPNEVCKL